MAGRTNERRADRYGSSSIPFPVLGLGPMTLKLPWRGVVTLVQPRIRLLRSFDQRSHNYLGYVLRLDGEVGGEHREFTVATGKAAQAKHEIMVGFDGCDRPRSPAWSPMNRRTPSSIVFTSASCTLSKCHGRHRCGGRAMSRSACSRTRCGRAGSPSRASR